MNPYIKVNNLSKIYQTTTTDTVRSLRQAIFNPAHQAVKTTRSKVAVDQVSFMLQSGDRLGIVGHNGAGKSTLLQMLAGLTQPSSGTIEVQGHVTAIMTLGVGLREDLSGRENIYVDGEVQGKSRQEVDQVIDQVIEFAELGEFIDYPVRTYSTGMKSRLAFSMIVYIQPEILIIDEALSAGDAVFASKATRKIKKICEQGKIVIIVSHGMGTITEMCNRCFWMDQGHIVMDGNPKDVTGAYLDAVKKADEETLLTKYRLLVKSQSFRTGCDIVTLETSYLNESQPRSIITVGKDVALKLQMNITTPLNDPDMKLEIMRLDGLLIEDSRLSDYEAIAPGNFFGSIAYTISMTPLLLGWGIYVITCKLLDNSEVIAVKSTIVEVIDPNPPTGGRPAIIYTYQSEVKGHHTIA
ncbi:ABC transporter ATP-binding protein [Cuspidothrix issatschenkoi]|uniref:ABC transporter ATP-binding protein n=1 Tax=Cuspidothrix issatschenkoi CHARLIE-1 TaxID=2052836 RepID=A0A2S6CTW3_9CYAN|nr:ABC transporter ATP-binding protein [Cuspidothrix issatschenkoi]PPJ63030.1 ABC transporter ATP-binding protein [Cuspidothrix issatschenkoi CHARLIE-1]